MAPFTYHASYPSTRLRRLRSAPWVRNLATEHRLSPHDLILPVFVQEGKNLETPIDAMPGVSRLSIDRVVAKAKEAAELGIPAIALFPVVDAKLKTAKGEEAYNPKNLICRTVRALKKDVPEIGVICDVALDPYTDHGQDGLVENGEVVNDKTVAVLCKQALVLAEAGCDVVAPSDMMDGRIGEVRKALDKKGFEQILILSYAAKYASCFYGPFREAVDSAAFLGKAGKATYQMNPANSDEALKEVALDIDEGADLIMVKPGTAYLDIVAKVAERFPVPVLAYQVSGEYAMLKAADEKGWLDFDRAMNESLIGFKRAGATAVFTYSAIEVAKQLSN